MFLYNERQISVFTLCQASNTQEKIAVTARHIIGIQ